MISKWQWNFKLVIFRRLPLPVHGMMVQITVSVDLLSMIISVKVSIHYTSIRHCPVGRSVRPPEHQVEGGGVIGPVVTGAGLGEAGVNVSGVLHCPQSFCSRIGLHHAQLIIQV